MPGLYSDYSAQCAAMKARRAKLIAKGIDPRSSKFLKLMYRRR